MRALSTLLERFPILQRPAYVTYTSYRRARNLALGFGLRRFDYVPKRLSDRGQDRWVIDEVFDGKRAGYFVELGAHDGFNDSNTLVLERHYGWTGLLIEPNPIDFAKITERHGRTATAVPLAVDPEGGELEFVLQGQISGLIVEGADFGQASRSEDVAKARAAGRVQRVAALPLEQILDEYGAPPVIDYFSLDVEGSETRVLRHFPFERYTFLALTIERPTPELNEILFANGYHFVRNSLYDTFYVHESIPRLDAIRREPFEQLPPKAF